MLSNEELETFKWKNVDVLIVNEGEGKDLLKAMIREQGADVTSSTSEEVLDGLDSLEQLSHTTWIVMTKGAKGVVARVKQAESEKRSHFEVPAPKPRQIRDTTGAGDTFAGYLVASLMQQSLSPQEVLQRAAMAATMAVETNGAMESIPRHQDVINRQRETLE
jgi:ribokinase